MRTVLICPGERPAVSFLAQSVPLVLVPLLGESVLAYWLEWLAQAGRKEVTILATDRPGLVRALVGDGARWGLEIEVRAELKELSQEEVREQGGHASSAGLQDRELVLLDRLPGSESLSLFLSYSGWFKGLLDWMPRVAATQRLGLREPQPGVWFGRRTRVARSARLLAPCWLGDHVTVGAETVIGPNAVLENRVVIEPAAEVSSSVVGPDTFVGSLTKIDRSIAWGNILIDWQTGSCTEVTDAFLLSALAQHSLEGRGGSPPRLGLRTLLTRPLSLLGKLPSCFPWR